MKLTIVDTLIVFKSVIASVMLFFTILLWIKKRELTNILLFLISLIVYIQITLNTLSYYHILNAEILLKIKDYPLISYLLDFILLILLIFYSIQLLKLSKNYEIHDESSE